MICSTSEVPERGSQARIPVLPSPTLPRQGGHRGCRIGAHHVLGEPPMGLPIIFAADAPQQLIGAPIIRESTVVVLHIVAEFSHGKSQLGLVPGSKSATNDCLRLLEPRRVGAGHLAIAVRAAQAAVSIGLRCNARWISVEASSNFPSARAILESPTRASTSPGEPLSALRKAIFASRSRPDEASMRPSIERAPGNLGLMLSTRRNSGSASNGFACVSRAR